MFVNQDQQQVDDLDNYYYDEDKDEDYPDDGPGKYTDDEDDDYEYKIKSDDEENGQDDVTQPEAPEMGAEQEADYNEAEAEAEAEPDDNYDESEDESEEAKEETDTANEDQLHDVDVLHGNDNILPGNTGVDTTEDPHEPTGVDNDDDSPNDGPTDLNIRGHNLQRQQEHTYHHLKTQSASQEWG